ncbi:MAG: spermidine synthase [Chloroflexi bacterium]|nr:spermidine synthase [Chloroflexota bacterium]
MTSAELRSALGRPRATIFSVPGLSSAPVRLFLTSGTLLFVELLLIRWIPANVTYIGFFSNFLLMASFLGIGLGILLGRRGRRLPFSPFALLLLVVVGIIIRAQLNVQLNSQDELFFGLAESRSADVNFLVLPLVVLLVTALMAALALPLGPLLKSMPPLKAYAVDIAGSMAGIAGFTALAASGTNPVVWFAVAAVLLLLLALGSGISVWSAVSGAAMAAVVFAVGVQAGNGDDWSPYYRLTSYRLQSRLEINVNGIPHQSIKSVDDLNRDEFYDQVYKWFPGRTYDNVLIVGAGSGTDTGIALAEGASRVEAVEIDPVIQQLGVDHHPDQPYADPRVTRHTNDGRAFLRNTSTRYDLIVFALPDSLTLVSTTANLRLESFLFTEEAFASVRDHLSEDGVFVLYNYYREPWLVEKLSSMLGETFGSPPIVRLYGSVRAAIAAGPAVAALNGGPPPGDAVDPIPEAGAPEPRPASDDWPFLYLRQPFIAGYYLVALAVILAGAAAAVALAARVTDTPLRRFSPHFFVLGTAFLLLETRSLVSFSLLFGTTWIVNALAFFAILASVLLAIFVNARFPIRRPTLLYAGLFIAIAIAFLLPPETLLIDPPTLRYGLAAALAFAPVFFANLVFSYSFRDTRTADMAFASNLLGAMVGGALEYLALLTGYRLLLVVVAVLYALAYLFATRWRVLADVDLAREEQPRPERAATPEPAV